MNKYFRYFKAVFIADVRLFLAPVIGGWRDAKEEIHRELAKRPIPFED